MYRELLAKKDYAVSDDILLPIRNANDYGRKFHGFKGYHSQYITKEEKAKAHEKARTWWKRAICYQIYPRSFKDSNGDGIGDLNGVTSKLDYLKDLGVNVLWICPMYKSPNDDNGYDISDYQAIMDEFGTMKDFDNLLKEAHKRGMKIILDLVVNHTSDEHEWFKESRSSKDNPKRNHYIWRKPVEGMPEPNNWESFFGGSVWEFDPETGEFYLHLFSKKQPDLNWENPEVLKEVFAMMKWWLNKGIDGFRVDAISHILKMAGLPNKDNPELRRWVNAFDMFANVPGIHKPLKRMKREVLSKYNIMTVGEANGVSVYEAPKYVDEKEGILNMIFEFDHTPGLWNDKGTSFYLPHFRDMINRWQYGLEGTGWNALYLENHDIPRLTSTYGNLNYLRESATAFGAVYFFLKGTPFIYQGQEIGMTNVSFDTIDQYNDVVDHNYYKIKSAYGESVESIMNKIKRSSRDNARTPVQWDASKNAGFTDGDTTWLGVNPNYTDINVAQQEKDPTSVLNFYKKMAKIRKEKDVIIYGKYDVILNDHNQIFAYTRTLGDEKVLVMCNLSDAEAVYDYKGVALNSDGLMLNNYEVDKHKDVTNIHLKPFETRVYKVL